MVRLCSRRVLLLPASFLQTWDSEGFCGHKSVLLSRHATWLDACCLGKLVPVLGAHGMLKLDTVLLGKELLVPVAGWPGHAPWICPSSLYPAANGNKSLELTGSSMGLAQEL